MYKHVARRQADTVRMLDRKDLPPLRTEAGSIKMWLWWIKSLRLTSQTFAVLFAVLAAEVGLFLLLAFIAASLRACSRRSLALSFNSSWRDSTLCVADKNALKAVISVVGFLNLWGKISVCNRDENVFLLSSTYLLSRQTCNRNRRWFLSNIKKKQFETLTSVLIICSIYFDEILQFSCVNIIKIKIKK